ncbi:YXWGXW repeat-containing protein [Lacisediminimonas profundi]|uniref:YXWGXW repeat-containing protein n=1 Tax=Lacisediminimonas profundi TaxID=2603856 RepID=UPI00124B012A|nr:YXWGXW repeat-containing protein [Lacisediminimonas profundi]
MNAAKHLLLSVALAGCCALPALASPQVGINIVIAVPPPPVQVESVPAPRHGHIWVPGFWNWDGYRHVWVPGHWETARAGYFYEPPMWEQADNGWRLKNGKWKQKKPHPHGCPPGQAKKGNC